MNSMKRFSLICLSLILLIGCSEQLELTKETDERAYRRGKSLLREGRKSEALEAFLSVVVSRQDAPDSHLEAGLLYLNHVQDPLAAIYHFRQFLALKPDTEHSPLVEELIMTAKKDFASSLPGNPFADEVRAVNLMEKVKVQEVENNELKTRVIQLEKELVLAGQQMDKYEAAIEQLQSRSSNADMAPIVIERASGTMSSQGSAQETVSPSTYTVESGDTLSRISQKVYGTSGRWMDIFQANRDVLPSPNALQVGQELRIP